MKKKIIFIILFLSILASCGKKDDPKYKQGKLNLSYNIILI